MVSCTHDFLLLRYVGLSDNENTDFRVEWIFDIRIYKLELVMNYVIAVLAMCSIHV